MPRRPRALALTSITALALSTAVVAAPSSLAAPSDAGCENRNNNTDRKLLECVTTDGVMEHLEALQAIADANDGTRADQTPGYQASVDYVVQRLEEAGWEAEVEPFTYAGTDTVLRQLTPTDEVLGSGEVTGAPEGDVSGHVTGVDLALEDPESSTSGCEASDFEGLDLSGDADVALVQRGTCSFAIKAENAEAAGAEAVVIMNQGNTEDRSGVLTNATLGADDVVDIPVVGASFPGGQQLAADGVTAQVVVDQLERTSYNVIGELRGRNDDNVVMAGAHLDSVPVGPGINDNGSGSAGLLEIAEQMGNHRPANTVRFAWWGAEELGLLGSTGWVEQRTPEQLDEIALYLNFDMIGSPNYIFQVYDADESTFEAPVDVPDGSIAIEDTFESFYTRAGEPYEDSAFSGRSDYQAFINNGIPSSGLFTGAEEIKTQEQADIWGGIAGEQFDQCYHQACDTIDNLDMHALDVNSDAVAFTVLTYATSTEPVNGVRGKKVPWLRTLPEPAGPEGTFAGGDGGAEHGDREVR